MVMTAAILYGYTDSVVDLIKETKDANWSSVRNKSEWMWLEIQRARNKVDILSEYLLLSGVCSLVQTMYCSLKLLKNCLLIRNVSFVN